MELDYFEDTEYQISQITKTQVEIAKKNLELRNNVPDFALPPEYFRRENQGEALREKKLRLIQRRNLRQIEVFFN